MQPVQQYLHGAQTESSPVRKAECGTQENTTTVSATYSHVNRASSPDVIKH